MELDPATLVPTLTRLRRAQGQLGAMIRMFEEGRTCTDVITQLAAVSRALDRAGFTLISASLEQCLLSPDGAVDEKELEKLFLSMA